MELFLFLNYFWNEPESSDLVGDSNLKHFYLCSNIDLSHRWESLKYLGHKEIVDARGSHKCFNISSTSKSVRKAEFVELLIDGDLWMTKFYRQCTRAFAWLLFNSFKQDLIFHNRRSPWPCFVFGATVTFFQMSEPILCHNFVNSSWVFHILNFFCHCPSTQSFFHRLRKMALIAIFHHSLVQRSEIKNKQLMSVRG